MHEVPPHWKGSLTRRDGGIEPPSVRNKRKAIFVKTRPCVFQRDHAPAPTIRMTTPDNWAISGSLRWKSRLLMMTIIGGNYCKVGAPYTGWIDRQHLISTSHDDTRAMRWLSISLIHTSSSSSFGSMDVQPCIGCCFHRRRSCPLRHRTITHSLQMRIIGLVLLIMNTDRAMSDFHRWKSSQ